eukprot:2778671-Lingulodinium_polyedra.AAC.1
MVSGWCAAQGSKQNVWSWYSRNWFIGAEWERLWASLFGEQTNHNMAIEHRLIIDESWTSRWSFIDQSK